MLELVPVIDELNQVASKLFGTSKSVGVFGGKEVFEFGIPVEIHPLIPFPQSIPEIKVFDPLPIHVEVPNAGNPEYVIIWSPPAASSNGEIFTVMMPSSELKSFK